MDLRRLEYFLVVAEELHLGRAAERLRVAQPGLSQQLRVLERELGVTLIDRRNPRRTVLTAAGEAMAEQGASLVDEVARIKQVVVDTAAGRTGRLRVSLSRSAIHGLPVSIINAFRDNYPHVDLTVTSSYTTLNLDQLNRHEIDVAFMRPPLISPPTTVEFTSLSREPFLVALPRAHRLAGHDRLTARDLADVPLVWWPREQAPGVWDRMLEQVYGTPASAVVVRWEPDEERMLAAVADGAGATFITTSRARALRPQHIVYRRFADPEPEVGIGLAWRSYDSNPVLGAFIELAQQEAG